MERSKLCVVLIFISTKGEIVTLIGANGAGKSTLLMSICGRVQARSGAIVLEGVDITKAPTHEIIQMGVSQSPREEESFQE